MLIRNIQTFSVDNRTKFKKLKYDLKRYRTVSPNDTWGTKGLSKCHITFFQKKIEPYFRILAFFKEYNGMIF
jgi:hypothetical protein